jgi:hypothetical protein
VLRAALRTEAARPAGRVFEVMKRRSRFPSAFAALSLCGCRSTERFQRGLLRKACAATPEAWRWLAAIRRASWRVKISTKTIRRLRRGSYRCTSRADDLDPIISGEVPSKRCFGHIGLCMHEAGDRIFVLGRHAHDRCRIRACARREIRRDRNRADKD